MPLDPAPEIWVTDTTFRDGQQSRAPYSVGQIVWLYDALHRLGGPMGIIRQSEFFLYAAGLLMWMQKHRPELAEGLGKRDERLARILELVMREYDDGRVTALADEEVHRLVDEAFGVGVA